MSPSEISWTSDRNLVRRVDGNAAGLEVVTTFLIEVSERKVSDLHHFEIEGMLTLVQSTTDITFNMLLATSIRIQQSSTICTEDQRSDCRHIVTSACR